jgi:hypothetical protein
VSALAKLRHATGRLHRDNSGLALLEFAFILPVVITMSLTGAELTNYITTKMRIGQIALQLSDDAARMGTGTQLSAKEISEGDISDLFTGAQLQSGELDLQTNGRVILTDLEPTTSPNTAGTYKIGWRRCYGNKTSYVRQYPTSSGTTGLTGIGPAGRQVTAQDDNATMFIEVFYTYRPIVGLGTLAPTTTFTEIASMAVRDRRDLAAGVNPTTGVTNTVC